MTVINQFRTGVFWTGIQQATTFILNFIISVILARLLEPEEFGIVAIVAVFIAFGHVFITSGMPASLIRTKDITQEDYSTVFFYNIGMGLMYYVIIAASSPLIADYFEVPLLKSIIRYQALIVIIASFGVIQMAKFTRELNFKVQARVAIPALLAGGFVGIIMAWDGQGVWSLVTMGLVQASTNTLLLWFYSDWRPSWSIHNKKMQYHWRFGRNILVTGLLNQFSRHLYAFVIGKYFSPFTLGLYQRADSLSILPVQHIAIILNKVSYPTFVKLEGDNEQLVHFYRQLQKTIFAVVTPLLLFAAALAKPLFIVLFGEKWLPAVPYFQIICWVGILFPSQMYAINLIKSKGLSSLLLKVEIILKLALVLIIALSLSWGIKGLLLGSVGYAVLTYLMMSYHVQCLIGYRMIQQIVDVLPIVFSGGAIALIIYALNVTYLNALPNLLHLLIAGLLGTILFLLLGTLLFRKTLLLFQKNVKQLLQNFA